MSLSLTNLAARIRDGWFGLLGSTNGFPYGTNLFFQAVIGLDFVMSNGGPVTGDASAMSPGLPFTLTATLTDSSGNVAGTGTFSITVQAQTVIISGNFDLTADYTLTLTGPTGWTFTITGFNANGSALTSIDTADLQASSSGTNQIAATVLVAPAGSGASTGSGGSSSGPSGPGTTSSGSSGGSGTTTSGSGSGSGGTGTGVAP